MNKSPVAPGEKNAFISKEIPPQFNFQPLLAEPIISQIQSEKEFIDKAIEIMKLQQDEEQKKQPADQIKIGGQVQVLTMKPNIMQIKIVSVD